MHIFIDVHQPLGCAQSSQSTGSYASMEVDELEVDELDDPSPKQSKGKKKRTHSNEEWNQKEPEWSPQMLSELNSPHASTLI